ncbi:MAG TPA: MFS transporter [Ktedonobacteraceae bacterium]|nr:MFS transporter [Ktedonobacteraceae bacterium]
MSDTPIEYEDLPIQGCEKPPNLPPQPTRLVKNIIIATICLGYFMVILDTTVVNVALPDITRQLGATTTGLQWIVDGYALVFASFLLTAGALGDRLGSKQVFLGGLVIFTVASALCGIAPNLWMLQSVRVVQGVGAALLVPAALALLNHSFADARERARVIGIWGGIAGIAGGAGPVVGGFLINALSWRSVFFLNVPLGMLGFLLTLRFVPLAPRFSWRGLDLAAQGTGIVTLGLLAFIFIQGGSWGWTSLPILSAGVVCVLAAGLFLFIERRTAHPMLPLKLFSSSTFSVATAAGLLLSFGFYGELFFISLFFQQVQGYSPFVTGLVLLPQMGVAVFASAFAGRVTGHLGPRVPMVIGLLLGGIGFLAMVFVGASTSYVLLCAMLMAIGFGTSFTMPAMTTAVIDSAPKANSGIAAAVLNASRQVGSVLGVALLGAFVSQRASFVSGMHTALGIAGGAFLLACVLTFVFVQRRTPPARE